MEASQEVVAEEALVRWIQTRHGTREWTTRRADTTKSRSLACKTQATAHTEVEDTATSVLQESSTVEDEVDRDKENSTNAMIKRCTADGRT